MRCKSFKVVKVLAMVLAMTMISSTMAGAADVAADLVQQTGGSSVAGVTLTTGATSEGTNQAGVVVVPDGAAGEAVDGTEKPVLVDEDGNPIIQGEGGLVQDGEDGADQQQGGDVPAGEAEDDKTDGTAGEGDDSTGGGDAAAAGDDVTEPGQEEGAADEGGSASDDAIPPVDGDVPSEGSEGDTGPVDQISVEQSEDGGIMLFSVAPPSCTDNGGTHSFGADGVCTVCGAKNDEAIGQCTHSFEDGVCSICKGVCDHDGATTGTCSECGATLGAAQDECSGGGSHEYGADDKCTKCGTLNPSHTHSYDSTSHKCVCGATDPQAAVDPENCTDKANHANLHVGETCGTCGYEGTLKYAEADCPDVSSHAGMHVGETCSKCGYTGTEKYDEADCPDKAAHSGLAAGETCSKCNYTKPAAVDPENCTDKANHANLHVGETCGTCGYEGTLKYAEADCPDVSSHAGMHVGETCSKCGYTGTEKYDEADCPDKAAHSGLAAGETCSKCNYVKPSAAHDCSVDGHVDTNNDGICDECGQQIATAEEPETPSRPERPTASDKNKDTSSSATETPAQPVEEPVIEVVEPTAEEAAQCDALVETLQQVVETVAAQEVSAAAGETKAVVLEDLGLAKADGWGVQETTVSDPTILVVNSVNPETLEVSYTALKSGKVDLVINLANTTLQKFVGYEEYAKTQITITIVIE